MLFRPPSAVLFIDEAYALDGDNEDFGGEAVGTLVKMMRTTGAPAVTVAVLGRVLDVHRFYPARTDPRRLVFPTSTARSPRPPRRWWQR